MQSILLILVSMVLMPGVIAKTKALLSSRKGASILQPWFDIFKLLKKGSIFADGSTFIFQIAPIIGIAVLLVALLMLPISSVSNALIHFKGDFLLFIYLMGLGKFFLIISALDIGSGFEGMGANREALYGMLVEPAFFMIMATLVLLTGQSSFQSIFVHFNLDTTSSVLFAVLAFYILLQFAMVEGSRLPIDDPKTHLELTMVHEVMILDNSGFDLAIIEIGNKLKMALFSTIITNIILSMINVPTYLAIIIYVGMALVFAITIGVAESFKARLKLTYNSQYILTISSISVVIFLMFLILENNL